MSEIKWLEEFGYRLRKQLEYAWMTRSELAEVTGISLPTICRYISGQQKPTIPNIINISRALDCDVDTLVNFDEEVY